MNIKGIIIDCVTSEERLINLEYEINEQDDYRLIFKLIGGPTGYEDFYIDDDYVNLKAMSERGWRACVGTKRVYDTLRISAEEMKKVLDYVIKITNDKLEIPKSTIIINKQIDLKNLIDQRKSSKKMLDNLDYEISQKEQELSNLMKNKGE